MREIFLFFILLTTFTVFSNEVELIINNDTPSYSFAKMEGYGGSMFLQNSELAFLTYEDQKHNDIFLVAILQGDISSIYDLGKKSCGKIESEFPYTRKSNPLFWLSGSEADPVKLEGSYRAEVKEGHCYLSVNNDKEGRIITLFRVKEHAPGEKVVLDEIEVLDKLLR